MPRSPPRVAPVASALLSGVTLHPNHLMTSTARAPAVIGLLVAWGGTALLVSPLGDRLGDPTSLSAALLAQALLWLLFAAVVVIVVFWEKQPLASLWLRPFQWRS